MSLQENQRLVGILDSGFGGLNVLDWALRLAPQARFIYFGDFAHAPYGSKDAPTVIRLVSEACEWLLGRDAEALVLACNTATSAAAADLRARLSVPVIGMEPALKPAALAHPGGRILVMATELTLREKKFRDLYARYAGACFVNELPCPGLASAIDRGDLPGAVARVGALLDECPAARSADAIVLGCSHYALVADAIRRWFGRPVDLFDGAYGTAKRMADVLSELGAAPSSRITNGDMVVEMLTLGLPKLSLAGEVGNVEFYLPGADETAQQKAWRLLEVLRQAHS
ncbi:MAG: glutamate racemase [Candidatus Sumerlaeota bacterium]|nr:glutamate racemase [Candidatus Sumerlaeota bacterium]